MKLSSLRLLGSLVSATALTLGTACASAAPSHAQLVGSWVSTQHAGGVDPGVLKLENNGVVRLQPQDLPAMQGYWYLRAGHLWFYVPSAGTSEMAYEFKAGQLVLHYSNGLVQTFHRKP